MRVGFGWPDGCERVLVIHGLSTVCWMLGSLLLLENALLHIAMAMKRKVERSKNQTLS